MLGNELNGEGKKPLARPKVLRAGTETEAIECALDSVISEHERNGLAVEPTSAS